MLAAATGLAKRTMLAATTMLPAAVLKIVLLTSASLAPALLAKNLVWYSNLICNLTPAI